MNDLYLRAVVVLVLVSVGFGTGWKVRAWKSDSDNAQVARQYAADLAAAEDRVHKAEQDALSRQASIEAGYLGKLEVLKNEKTAALSAANKLGVWVTTSETCNSAVSGTTSSHSGGHDGTKVRLAEDDAGFILNLAATADQYAEQIKACQQIIIDDRK